MLAGGWRDLIMQLPGQLLLDWTSAQPWRETGAMVEGGVAVVVVAGARAPGSTPPLGHVGCLAEPRH